MDHVTIAPLLSFIIEHDQIFHKQINKQNSIHVCYCEDNAPDAKMESYFDKLRYFAPLAQLEIQPDTLMQESDLKQQSKGKT